MFEGSTLLQDENLDVTVKKVVDTIVLSILKLKYKW